jgi:hypothetical protein
MNKKGQKTLQAIFAKPTRSDIKWQDIESLLVSMGAVISEGRGSRVRIHFKGWCGIFHRPHPKRETIKGAVDQIRKDLTRLGVKPK